MHELTALHAGVYLTDQVWLLSSLSREKKCSYVVEPLLRTAVLGGIPMKWQLFFSFTL